MSKKITVVMPHGAIGGPGVEGRIENMLRTLGQLCADKDEWADKYGTNFENETFMMHRFCWCEKEDCKWCSDNEPNFIYKPSGFSLTWHKYIGRGMEMDDISLKDALLMEQACLKSIGAI